MMKKFFSSEGPKRGLFQLALTRGFQKSIWFGSWAIQCEFVDVKKIGYGVLTALKVARLGRSDGEADVVRVEARVAAALHRKYPFQCRCKCQVRQVVQFFTFCGNFYRPQMLSGSFKTQTKYFSEILLSSRVETTFIWAPLTKKIFSSPSRLKYINLCSQAMIRSFVLKTSGQCWRTIKLVQTVSIDLTGSCRAHRGKSLTSTSETKAVVSSDLLKIIQRALQRS